VFVFRGKAPRLPSRGLGCRCGGRGFCRLAGSLDLWFRQETHGSRKFPSCPREHVPRSQTPVASRPLASARLGLLPSGAWKPSAFSSCPDYPVKIIRSPDYLRTTIIPISGFNRTARVLDSPMKGCRGNIPGSAPPLPASARDSLLVCWLDFSQTGLSLFRAGTRWAALVNFIDCSTPSTSGLSCRDHAVVRRPWSAMLPGSVMPESV